jgi:hypothetical protein
VVNLNVSPFGTLRTYAHLFKTADGAAAAAVESMFREER